jgi:hypothetical protein
MDRSQTSSNLRYKIESDNSTAKFYMNPAEAYSGQFPHFSQPKEIGTMSSEKRVKYLTENNLETHKATDADENKINTYGVKYLGNLYVVECSFLHEVQLYYYKFY